jgi:arylsulfatase A-like enzyme
VGGASIAIARGQRELGEPGKQYLAWCFLALLNQGLILVLLPKAQPSVMALHHAYDLGQLLAMGALSFCALAFAGKIAKTIGWIGRPWARIALVALTAFAFALGIVGDDVSNFAERMDVSGALLATLASLAFAVVLSGVAFVPLPSGRFKLPLLLVLGSCVAIGNGWVLAGDYFAFHLLSAWLAAQLIVRGLDGVRMPARLEPRVAAALAAVGGTAGVATLAIAPPAVVLQRLFSLPSSAPAPIVARFLPESAAADQSSVPAEYLSSAWFKDRARLTPTPPTRAWQPPDDPIVILLTIDALRADVVANEKHDKMLPVLSRMRKQAVHFSLARSTSPGTIASFTSLFSGKYYSGLRFELQPRGKVVPVRDTSPRFPQVLTAAGVHTSHVMGFAGIGSSNGVANGFTAEHSFGDKAKASQSVDRIIEELEASVAGPRFIFTHFLEPHAPYSAGGKKGSFNAYLREVAVVDKQIGRLRKFLKQKGLEDRTILIVAADHGEAFGEHGMSFHAKAIYEEFLRVPLLVDLPGVEARTVSTPVTLLDIGPTILDIFDLPVPPTFMGESLVPLIVGESRELSRPIAAESGRRMQALYLKDGKKVILDVPRHSVEVYDLNLDPGELRNLADTGRADVHAAIETTRLFFDVQRLKLPGWSPPYRRF